MTQTRTRDWLTVAVREHLLGAADPTPQTYRDIAGAVYETDDPTRAQRHAVARSCRRLLADGVIVNGSRWDLPPRSRIMQRHPRYVTACEGPDCLRCADGNRPRKDGMAVTQYPEIARRDRPEDADEQIALAEQHGVHEWIDYTQTVEREESAGGTDVGVRRPYTDEEQVAADAKNELMGKRMALAMVASQMTDEEQFRKEASERGYSEEDIAFAWATFGKGRRRRS